VRARGAGEVLSSSSSQPILRHIHVPNFHHSMAAQSNRTVSPSAHRIILASLLDLSLQAASPCHVLNRRERCRVLVGVGGGLRLWWVHGEATGLMMRPDDEGQTEGQTV
jgi:hypothetical protein